ncbi:nicF [Symbiodinium pilosum]|uniref:NicF protein n=1 Tax=Symbiodinium pilosum TaxID=2952 RepID=A0A812UPE4_SYMPI|nr:nicF [Symbiodinium pilosum]
MAFEDNASNYKSVFNGCLGFGVKCAVVAIDFTKAYTTPGSPFFCPGKGYGVVDAVAESKPLLELARAKSVPIFYTKVYYEHPTDGGVFTQKIPSLRTWIKENPLVEIDESITPHAGDSVLVKQYPSAFFGTNLACNLRAIGVDTCIMVGCSTSGCIRASVLDGMQQGFRCIVPRECVGDRTQSVHESNLFDINAKNGDVMPKQAVMDHLGSC